MKHFLFILLLLPYSLIGMTDKDLPHISPEQAGQIYALMMKVDQLLDGHDIYYWAGWGTLLGAIRHKGLIPWDDDLDIALLEEDIESLKKLEPLLKEKGLTLLGIEKENKVHYFKIFPSDGKTYDKYPWRYPFVDIFPMTMVDQKIRYASERLRKAFDKEYFLLDEELSAELPKVQFGPMTIPIPHNAANILTRLYGSDWNEMAYAQYNHKEEQKLEKIKVPLVERAEVEYILPE